MHEWVAWTEPTYARYAGAHQLLCTILLPSIGSTQVYADDLKHVMLRVRRTNGEVFGCDFSDLEVLSERALNYRRRGNEMRR